MVVEFVQIHKVFMFPSLQSLDEFDMVLYSALLCVSYSDQREGMRGRNPHQCSTSNRVLVLSNREDTINTLLQLRNVWP